MQEYEQSCPNGTFCTDGEVCRVAFMTSSDAAHYIQKLESFGFVRPGVEGSPEVAVINERRGFEWPCDWLEVSRVDFGDGQSAETAWAKGTKLSTMVALSWWRPGTIRQIPMDELEAFEFLGSKDGVQVFRDKVTGEEVFVGRTQEGAPPAHLSRSRISERFESLAQEL